MRARLFLLFLIVPLADLWVLTTLGGRLGWGSTILLVVASAALGATLARREGIAAWGRIQSRLASGAVPGRELVEGLIVLASAVLLVAPGFLTDALGLLGLLPPVRRAAGRWLQRRWARGVAAGRIHVVGTVIPAGPAAVEEAEVVGETRRPHNVASARL